MKRITKLLSLILSISIVCSLFTGCNQSADEGLIARNNAIAGASGLMFTTDEMEGVYSKTVFLNYIDTQKATGSPVCGKPECTHELDGSSECFAVQYGLNGNSIYYYQDHLYYCKGGVFYQSDSIGNNEKKLADFGELINQEIETVLKQDDDLKIGSMYGQIVGIHDGNLYIIAQMSLQRMITDAFTATAFRYVYALFTCDLKTGSVERCQDETLCTMVEDIPLTDEVSLSLCGDLLFVTRDTTKRELLPVPDGFLEDENWTEKWINGDFVKETKGDTIYQAYSLAEKKVLKEWSVPDTEETRQLLMIQINADRTFLHVEQADGKYRYTEYNQNYEKTAEFTLEQDAKVIKHGEYYYYKFLNQNETDFYRYNPKTKQTDILNTDGTMDLLGIVGGVIFGNSSVEGYEYALLDLSCFDTGKAEVQPVEGIAPLRRD